MKYKITCWYRGIELCDQIIGEIHDAAAIWHYESLSVRQPSSPYFEDYVQWQLERLPVEKKLIEKGETYLEKTTRQKPIIITVKYRLRYYRFCATDCWFVKKEMLTEEFPAQSDQEALKFEVKFLRDKSSPLTFCWRASIVRVDIVNGQEVVVEI